MKRIQEIEKRLKYIEDNNLFDSHYINDMKHLLAENKRYKETINDVLFECEVPISDITAIKTLCMQALKEE